MKRSQFGESGDSEEEEEAAHIMRLNDPMWGKMWYLNREGGLNMDVEGAWRQGFTGRGVSVTILDDGIEKDHPGM